jgi:hypothetical protein
MSVSINGTTGLVFNDGSTQATAASGFGFKNRLINGAMVIDQRNAGASVTPAVNSYTVDRWLLAMSQASKISVQQNAGAVTPPAGFTNYLGLTTASAYTPGAAERFIIQQRIEGFNVADFAWGTASAQAVTVSFKVRASITGTYGASIRNNAGDRSYPISVTVSAANTWEEKTVTIPGDTSGTWLTNNGVGLVFNFSLGAGSSFKGTAGAWTAGNIVSVTGAVDPVATSGATFYFTGLQLEKGSTATSFDYRPYGTELALCQRYFQVVKPPLAISAAGTIDTTLVCVLSYPVQMRATPTVSQSGVFRYEIPFGDSKTQSSANATFDAPSTNNVGAAIILGNFSSLTYSRTYRPDLNTNALLFSAEL